MSKLFKKKSSSSMSGGGSAYGAVGVEEGKGSGGGGAEEGNMLQVNFGGLQGKINTDVVLGDDNSMSRKLMRSKSMRQKEQDKFEKMIDASTASAPPAIVPYIKKATKCLAGTAVFCECCLPIYARIAWLIYKVLSSLPKDELTMIYGGLLCFFGGAYPMTMAATEALRQCGGQKALESLSDLAVQFENAKNESDADDKIDADNNNIPDVEEISAKELLARKTKLVFTATDPLVLDTAFKGVYSGWAAVIAVLKLQFARTVALGSAIGDFATKALTIPVTKVLVHSLEPELHKWIPQLISYVCKIIGILVAYHLQVIISTFYASIRGGLMISRTALTYASRKLGSTKYGKWIPEDLDATYMDEIAGWALAAAGFYSQFKYGFGAPFFLQILLWPLGFLEASLVAAVYSPSKM